MELATGLSSPVFCFRLGAVSLGYSPPHTGEEEESFKHICVKLSFSKVFFLNTKETKFRKWK